MTVSYGEFHPMRGHVQDGTQILYSGYSLFVRGTLRGWVLRDEDGATVGGPFQDAYTLTQAVLSHKKEVAP